MREYSVLAIAGVIGVLAVELLWLKTGVLRRRSYWVAMAIVFFFQALVDGWLTKLSSPIVIYSADEFWGVRFPWDIPVEDFLFGFALVTLAIVLWERSGSTLRA